MFDVRKMIQKAKDLQSVQSGGYPILSRRPLDRIEGVNINLPGIAVGALRRGLSLQVNDPLKLISPQGIFNQVGQEFDFEWEVDTGLIGDAPYEVRLYVSVQQDGFGLWPEDPKRRRNEPELGLPASLFFGSQFDTEPTWTGEDVRRFHGQ